MASLSSNSHQAEKQRVLSQDCLPKTTREIEVIPAFRRRSSVSFDDGNLAILAGQSYILVHRGFICRHSAYLAELAENLKSDSCIRLEGRPVLELMEPAEDVSLLFHALYDGVTTLFQQSTNLRIAFVLFRLASTYHIEKLRSEALAFLKKGWPSSLGQWNRRERHVPRFDSDFARAMLLPHPIAVINLARRFNAPELLPAALYELSRYPPSLASAGLFDPHDGLHHVLTLRDLTCLLRGREAASRFLSTFMVNELEGRKPSSACRKRSDDHPDRWRECQSAFDLVTFELLCDVNGVVIGRTSDPLFAMLEAVNMQAHPGDGGAWNLYRPCDVCRDEFAATVYDAREHFWRKLPEWFGIDVPGWG
eukprot:GHVU01152401.1.p1 GENE.GHVU01152401.1~~GHVU01152401.1.p1  ORF type:complete len:383 (+),score=29.59 GHVU01152401.1:56-1150(+)